MSRRALASLLFVFSLTMLGAPGQCVVDFQVNYVSPMFGADACDSSLPVSVAFTRAVDPAIAVLTAQLVEGLDGVPSLTDVSALYTLAPNGASADLTLSTSGRALLTVNVDVEGDGVADDFDTLTIDVLGDSCLAPVGSVAIWEIPPVDASIDRLNAIAAELGITGAATVDGAGAQLLATETGFSGPFSIFFDGGRYTLRPLLQFSTPANSFAPRCSDLRDNDIDGDVDRADVDCEDDLDDDEATAGFQDRADGDTPRLNATAALDATFTVDSASSLPSFAFQIAGGGTIAGDLRVLAGGAGSFDLTNGQASMTLALGADMTCTGAGCFTGTCTLVWAPTIFSFPYSGDSAANLPLARQSFAGFDVTSCDDGAQTLGEVQALIAAENLRGDLSGVLRIDPAFRDDESYLSINARDGSVTYATIVGTQDVGRILGSDADAIAAASDLLTRINLLPPEPEVTVFRIRTRDDSADSELQVAFVPTLPLGDGTRAEVLGGWVRVRLGASEQLLGLESRWRGFVGPTPFATAPFVSPSIVAGEPVDGSVFSLQHHARNVGKWQKFYSPVYSLGEEGEPEAYVLGAATNFIPSTELEVPQDPAGVDGSGPITLSASSVGGTPPYTYAWESDVDGPLGAGAELSTLLSNGSHVLQLVVSDANGANDRLASTIKVVNSSKVVASQQETGPLPINGTITGTLQRYKFKFSERPGFATPAASMISQFGDKLVDFELKQFRFNMKVDIGGSQFEIQSGRCRDVNDDTDDGLACTFPKQFEFQFVVFDADRSIEPQVDGKGAAAVAHYMDVPGELRITTQYKVRPAPAPSLFGIEATASTAPAILKRRAQSLLGVHLAIVPEVDWEFRPPPPPADDIERFEQCIAFGEIAGHKPTEGDPDEVGFTDMEDFSQISQLCGNGATATITDFELTLYTLAQPDPGSGQISTWVNDNDSFVPTLRGGVTFDATEGVVNCSRRGLFLNNLISGFLAFGGDAFCEIIPFTTERSRVVVKADGSAAPFDNFHAKTTTPTPNPLTRLVVIPGCNDVFDITRLATATGNKNPTRGQLDMEICFHIHERYMNNPTFSQDQDITWHAVRRRPGEFNSMRRPDKFVNGETMFIGNVPAPGFVQGMPQVLWLESKAKSDECGKSGDVSNFGSPCEAFRSPIFPTH